MGVLLFYYWSGDPEFGPRPCRDSSIVPLFPRGEDTQVLWKDLVSWRNALSDPEGASNTAGLFPKWSHRHSARCQPRYFPGQTHPQAALAAHQPNSMHKARNTAGSQQLEVAGSWLQMCTWSCWAPAETTPKWAPSTWHAGSGVMPSAPPSILSAQRQTFLVLGDYFKAFQNHAEVPLTSEVKPRKFMAKVL